MTSFKTLFRTAPVAAVFLVGASFAAAQSAGSSAAIEQQGDYNRTEITQSGDGNYASAEIHGNYNRAGTITQTGNGAYAQIYVAGDNNRFDIDQRGPAYGIGVNAAYSGIYGNGNKVDVDQVSTTSDAYRNFAGTTQYGNNHTAIINQTASAYYEELSGANIGLINQKGGTGNTGTITQNGTDNYAEINQDGDHNTGTITQNGTGLHQILNQIGDNIVTPPEITQTGCDVPGGCGTMVVTQTQDPLIYAAPAPAGGAGS